MTDVRSLDHFAISVLDVDRAGDTFARLGFQTLPLTRHIELGSCNRVIQLHETYLEVVGHFERAPAQLKDRMLPRYATGEGLSIVSLTCLDLEAERTRIGATVWTPDPIVNARRRIPMPDGSEDETDSSCLYVWRPDRLYSTLFFSVHRRPETIWIASYQVHPNTARRVTRLTYYSAEPQLEVDYVQTMLGAKPVHSAPDRVEFQTARGESIEILGAARVRERYAGLAPSIEASEPVFGIALSIEVDDLVRCLATLDANNVPYEHARDTVTVPASHAHGVVLEFRAGSTD